MAAFGVSDYQSRIVQELTQFFTDLQMHPDRHSVDKEHALMRALETILQYAERDQIAPGALSFDVECTLFGQVYPLATLMAQVTKDLTLGLGNLSARYGVTFSGVTQPMRHRSPPPTKLKQLGETLVDELDEPYALTHKLTGRGQPGLANFYLGPDGFERLIKEDEVATCLMEGTAYYIRDTGLLPGALANSVNYATLGVLQKADGAAPSVVSIQDRVVGPSAESKVRSWDELVYGVKRNPKTLLSFEGWYPQAILENITLLNTTPKWQLAAGIMASAIAGDESLHVGQFMAILDSASHVVGIKRIDLGARERYAVARSMVMQDPYNASTFYVNSGQYGKNYVSYLLSEPGLRSMYTMLWLNVGAKEHLEETIQRASFEAFIKQFNQIPPHLQSKAIVEVLSTINKGVPKGKEFVIDLMLPIEKQIERLATKIAEGDALRVVNMVAESKSIYAQYERDVIQKVTALLPSEDRALCQDCLAVQRSLVLSRELATDALNMALENTQKLNALIANLIARVNETPSDELYKQIQLLTGIGIDLVQAATLNLHHKADVSPQITSDINKHLNQLQTYHELSIYCLETAAQEKKQYATRMMLKTLEGEEALMAYIKNPALIDTLKLHQSAVKGMVSSSVVKVHTRGEMLLTRLFKRYYLDDRILMMTEPQHTLIQDIKAKNFSKVANDVKSLTITDVLTPDQNGKTALHYLMELGGGQQDALVAVLEIFRKAIGMGVGARSDLDIQDSAGLTPFDYLMAQPNASGIIHYINGHKLKGGYGPWAEVLTVDKFFNLDKYPPLLKEQYHRHVTTTSEQSFKLR